MAMDLRDVYDWTDEARRAVLLRRLEAYNSALLPHQKPEDVARMMTGLQSQLEAIDRGAEIEAVEQENARTMAEKNARLRERQRAKRAERKAGVAPKKKYKVPAGATVLAKAKVLK